LNLNLQTLKLKTEEIGMNITSSPVDSMISYRELMVDVATRKHGDQPGLSKQISLTPSTEYTSPATPDSLNFNDQNIKTPDSVSISELLPTPESITVPEALLGSGDSQASILDTETPSVPPTFKTGESAGLRLILQSQGIKIVGINQEVLPSILEFDGELLGQQLGLIEQKLFKGMANNFILTSRYSIERVLLSGLERQDQS
jgi:hypothetical protein